MRRIAKNVTALALMEITTRLLSLVLIVAIARFLGDTEFGRYSFAFAFTSLFIVLVDPGINTLTIRDIAREKDAAGKYLGNIFIMRLILSATTFAIILGLINLMGYPSETKLAVYIVGIYTIMTSFSQLTRSIFRAFERMEYEALLNILERVIFVSLGLLVLYMGYGLIEVVSVFLIAGIVNLILSFALTVRKFAKPKFEVDLGFWKHLIKEGLPFGLAIIFVTMYMKIGIVVLSILKGDSAAGLYNAAYQIPFAVSLISFAYMESIFPILSRFYKSSKKSFIFACEKSFKFLFLISLPVAVAVTMLSDRIIFLLYGSNFIPASIALRIMIWFTIFEFWGYLFYTVLASLNRQKSNTINTFICAVFNVIMNLLLIPPLSYIGASIATLLTYVLYFTLNFYSVSKFYNFISLSDLIKPLLASIIIGVFLFVFKDLNILILLIFAIPLYFLLLYAMGTFSTDEIALWKNIRSDEK